MYFFVRKQPKKAVHSFKSKFLLCLAISFALISSIVYAAVPSKPSSPSISSSYHPVNQSIPMNWPTNKAGITHKYYVTSGPDSGLSNTASSAQIYANAKSTSSSPSHSKYGYYWYFAKACNSSNQCSDYGEFRRIVLYTNPGGVNNLSASPSSTNAGETINVSWTTPGGAVPGATYKVFVNSVLKAQTNTKSYNFSALAGNNAIVVQACNPQNAGCGSSRTVSVTGIVPSPGKASTPLANSSYHPVNSSITISWPSALGATSYRLYEDGSQIYSGSGLSKSRSQSTYGRRVYTVEACNSGGCGARSSSFPIYYYTVPGPVTNLSVSPKTTSAGNTATVTWGAAGGSVPGATYKLYINGTLKTQTTALRYSFSVPAGNSQIKVRACNPNISNCGGIQYSSVSGIVPTPGKASSPSASSSYHPVNSSITISWPSVSGATSYRLYEDGSQIYSGSGLSKSRSQSTYGRRVYTVEACNGGGCGAGSSSFPIYYYTIPGPVTNLLASPTTTNSGNTATLTWGAAGGSVPGVTYKVFINDALKAETTALTYSFAVASGENTIKIRACNPSISNCGGIQSKIVTGTLPRPSFPIAPNFSTSYHPVNTPVDVTWPIDTADITHKYYVTSGPDSGLTNTASSAQIYANAVETTNTPNPAHSKYGYYWYFAKACNQLNICSEYGSFHRIVAYTTPGPVTNLLASPTTTNSGNMATLTWGAAGGSVPGVTYKVFINDALKAETTALTYSFAVASGENTIKIRACNPSISNCGGIQSKIVTGTLPRPSFPIAPSFSTSYHPVNTPVDVTWPIDTADITHKYYVTSGPDSGLTNTASSAQIYANAVETTNTPNPAHSKYGYYWYFAKACNQLNICSEYGSFHRIVAYTVPGGITNLAINKASVNIGETFELSWEMGGGFVQEGGFYKVTLNGEVVYSGALLNFPTSIFEYGEFEFIVQACNPRNVGCGSSRKISVVVVSVDPKTPQEFLVPANTPEGATINIWWKAPEQTGVKEYEVFGELKGTLVKQVFTLNSDGYFHYTRPSLPEGREYCYKVRAWFYDGSRGNYSETLCTIVGELAFNKPVTFFAEPSVEQVSYYDLYWSEVSGADHYLLEKEISLGIWEEVACDMRLVSLSDASYQHCSVKVSVNDVIPEKGVSVYRVAACNAANVCGNYERTNFALMTVSNKVYSSGDGKLYFQLSNNQNGRFVELAKNAQGEWVVSILTQQQWDALSPTTNFTLSNYTLEFGEFSGDSLEDFKLTNGGEVIVIVQTEAGIYTPTLGKKILFIHTDILGTPVAETNANGAIN